MTFLYRTILRDAWNITRHKRWLWVFGLFVAFLGGGGEYNLIAKNVSIVRDEGAVLTSLSTMLQQSGIGVWYDTVVEVIGNMNPMSIVLLLITIIAIIGVFILAVISQGALVSGIFRVYKGSKPSLNESWNRGKGKLKDVFVLNIVGKIVLYIVFAIIAFPFFYLFLQAYNLVWQWVLVLISFLIFVPLAIVISFLIKYAIIFAVVKNNDIKLALSDSWRLFRNNWIVSLEMALILFIINLLVGLGIMIGMVFVAAPFLMFAFVGVYFDISILFWLSIVFGAFVLFVGVFTIGAMLSVFQTASWVILFDRIVEGAAVPKIVRFVAGLPRRTAK